MKHRQEKRIRRVPVWVSPLYVWLWFVLTPSFGVMTWKTITVNLKGKRDNQNYTPPSLESLFCVQTVKKNPKLGTKHSPTLIRDFPFLLVSKTNITTKGIGFAPRIKLSSLEELWKPLHKILNTASSEVFWHKPQLNWFMLSCVEYVLYCFFRLNT